MPKKKKAEPVDTARVAMIWPVDLKEAVRAQVSTRGMTKFTLEAVRAKLGVYDAQREAEEATAEAQRQLDKARDLAQDLADAIATSSPESFDAFEALREAGLPSWIDTTGWPEQMAHLVRPEDAPPAVVARPAPQPPADHVEPERVEPEPEPVQTPIEELNGPEFERPGWKNEPKPEPEPAPDPEPATPRNDLFARMMAKAKERGIDADLDFDPSVLASVKSGSEIPQPAPEPESSAGSNIGPVSEPPSEPPSESAPVPETNGSTAVCATCGSPLVAGECWECF